MTYLLVLVGVVPIQAGHEFGQMVQNVEVARPGPWHVQQKLALRASLALTAVGLRGAVSQGGPMWLPLHSVAFHGIPNSMMQIKASC